MSPLPVHATRRGLWLALVAGLPVPIWLLGPGRVPPAHLAELGGAALAVGLSESLRGVVGLTAAVLLGQALGYAAGLWGVAALLARAFGRHGRIALALAALALGAACIAPVYHSPYTANLARVTLLQVYR